eukprot:jgi/Orpsp1_1/1192095/evm.model.d7180000090561.1
MNEFSIKKTTSNDTSISKVINLPLNINRQQNRFTLLQLLCKNSLGLIIDFIVKTSNSVDIFYIEDRDGNTPLHFLCRRVDELEMNEEDSSKDSIIKNFTSAPSSTNIIMLIKYLADFVDLSIKNKNKLAPEDVTTNILVHRICYSQMINKKNNMFPSQKPNNGGIIYKSEWNLLFNLKDPKQKDRTLLHHLCIGDRLGAIKIKIPSGFRNISGKFSGNNKDLIFGKSEIIILEETEKIAEFLIEKGADFSSESYCDMTDIMYRLYKKKNDSTIKKPLVRNLVSFTKSIASGLLKYSCFPFGNFMNNKNNNEIKFITIPSIYNQNSESEETLTETLI